MGEKCTVYCGNRLRTPSHTADSFPADHSILCQYYLEFHLRSEHVHLQVVDDVGPGTAGPALMTVPYTRSHNLLSCVDVFLSNLHHQPVIKLRDNGCRHKVIEFHHEAKCAVGQIRPAHNFECHVLDFNLLSRAQDIDGGIHNHLHGVGCVPHAIRLAFRLGQLQHNLGRLNLQLHELGSMPHGS